MKGMSYLKLGKFKNQLENTHSMNCFALPEEILQASYFSFRLCCFFPELSINVLRMMRRTKLLRPIFMPIEVRLFAFLFYICTLLNASDFCLCVQLLAMLTYVSQSFLWKFTRTTLFSHWRLLNPLFFSQMNQSKCEKIAIERWL
jgi:hypothetical protein